jgi:DNA-binding SARP family transcriptional activator
MPPRSGPEWGRPLPTNGRLLGDMFDALPTAVLLVSERKQVVTWNPAIEQLLERRFANGATCCNILGCRRVSGTLADACLTELALARTGGLVEFEIEIAGLERPLLVTSRVVPGPRERFALLQFCPVPETADAKAPVVEEEAPTISIATLGSTVVELPSGSVHDGWLDQRTGRLLKYLVAQRGRPVHAEAIAEALWPRARTDSTNTVRHFIHALREKLEPSRDRYARSEFVLCRNGGYTLNLERIRIDAEEFESHARAGLAAHARGDKEGAAMSLTLAANLYRGDFLTEERYQDWAIAERERLLDLACQVLRALADAAPNSDHRAEYLEQLADLVPLDAEVQRELIEIWLVQGKRTRSLRRYRTLESRLMREFGERISFDLGELARGTNGSNGKPPA